MENLEPRERRERWGRKATVEILGRGEEKGKKGKKVVKETLG
jgi:hypothetical protein